MTGPDGGRPRGDQALHGDRALHGGPQASRCPRGLRRPDHPRGAALYGDGGPAADRRGCRRPGRCCRPGRSRRRSPRGLGREGGRSCQRGPEGPVADEGHRNRPHRQSRPGRAARLPRSGPRALNTPAGIRRARAMGRHTLPRRRVRAYRRGATAAGVFRPGACVLRVRQRRLPGCRVSLDHAVTSSRLVSRRRRPLPITPGTNGRPGRRRRPRRRGSRRHRTDHRTGPR
jgi:hypothetical protein